MSQLLEQGQEAEDREDTVNILSLPGELTAFLNAEADVDIHKIARWLEQSSWLPYPN